MAQNTARLGVVMGIDTTEFIKGLQSAKQSVTSLANEIPKVAALGVAAFTAMTYKALQLSDQMSDLSDATGIGIAKILQISEALEMSGGHADNASKVLTKFNQTIDDAAQGSQKAQDAFTRIGVSLDDLRKLSPEELLKKASDGVAKLGDAASRTGAAIGLFGKGIKGVDMQAFNQEIQNGAEEYQRYANAVAVAADLHDKLAKKAFETSLIFAQKILPTINAMFEAINTKGGLAETVFDTLNKGLLGLWYTAEGLKNAFSAVGIAWQALTGKISVPEMQKQIAALNEQQLDFAKKMRDLDAGRTDKPAKAGETGANRDIQASAETKKLNEMLAMAKLLSVEYERQQNFNLQQLITRNAMAGLTNNERKVQEAINQVLDSTSRKIDEITKKREDAAGRGADRKVLEEYDKQIEKIKEMQDTYVNAVKTQEQITIDAQRTFEYGWNKAFNQFAEDAGNYAKEAQDMFDAITGNMSSAIDKFVDSGKLAFGDLAKSILKDLIKIELKMQAMQLFSMFRSGIGSLFTPTPQYKDPAYEQAGYADGGDPPVGVPSLVGERGPELFIPRTSGTIIPNNQLGNAFGSSPQPQNVFNGPYIENMQAIDTQSATQFLAKNKNAVYAANQSASRGMPTSR